MLRTPRAPALPFELVCPTCRGGLEGHERDERRCQRCRLSYHCHGGIWRFLPAQRAAAFEQFEREYLTVRRAEGWGSHDAAYYRELPFKDLSGRFGGLWRMRARSFKTLLQELPIEQPLRILDLGAGNGWLSYQLAIRGHVVVAIDVHVDEQDGLGALKHYDAAFTPIQAEFDRLPIAAGQADVAIFNGSLHYSTDIASTLGEALRVLHARGTIAILDSPMYSSATGGQQMVQERERRFQQTYGFASDSLPAEHYLTPARLEKVGGTLGIHWRIREPFRGWRRSIAQPLWARIRGTRQPARFPLIVGERT